MKKIKIVELIQTCGACPSQWDGITKDGGSVYIRFRHGSLRVELNGDSIFHYSDNRVADGSMDTDEMMEITSQVIKWRLISPCAVEE